MPRITANAMFLVYVETVMWTPAATSEYQVLRMRRGAGSARATVCLVACPRFWRSFAVAVHLRLVLPPLAAIRAQLVRTSDADEKGQRVGGCASAADEWTGVEERGNGREVQVVGVETPFVLPCQR
jgi:hypothetical protein